MINRGLLRLLIFSFLFLYYEGRVLSQPSQESEYPKIVKEGIAEYETGRFEEALRLFEEAHAMKPSARTLRGIGMAAFGARDYVAAIEALEKSLVDRRRPLAAKMRENAATLLRKAKLFVGRYHLYIEPLDDSVALTIDGNSAELPLNEVLLLNPGEHQLVISAVGYKTEIRKITVVSNKTGELKIALDPIKEQKVENFGQSFETAPVRKHANEELSVNDNEADSDPIFNTSAWISVAASALSLGGGIAALILRNSKVDEYNSCGTDDDQCRDAASAINDAEILEIIGFAGAGVFAGAAITFFILDYNQSNNEQLAMVCDIKSSPVGVSCRARF